MGEGKADTRRLGHHGPGAQRYGRLCCRVAQWDVQNEHIRNHYYEERLGQRNITKILFRKARHADPNVPLYFNDYDAAGAGTITRVC